MASLPALGAQIDAIKAQRKVIRERAKVLEERLRSVESAALSKAFLDPRYLSFPEANGDYDPGLDRGPTTFEAIERQRKTHSERVVAAQELDERLPNGLPDAQSSINSFDTAVGHYYVVNGLITQIETALAKPLDRSVVDLLRRNVHVALYSDPRKHLMAAVGETRKMHLSPRAHNLAYSEYPTELERAEVVDIDGMELRQGGSVGSLAKQLTEFKVPRRQGKADEALANIATSLRGHQQFLKDEMAAAEKEMGIAAGEADGAIALKFEGEDRRVLDMCYSDLCDAWRDWVERHPDDIDVPDLSDTSMENLERDTRHELGQCQALDGELQQTAKGLERQISQAISGTELA